MPLDTLFDPRRLFEESRVCKPYQENEMFTNIDYSGQPDQCETQGGSGIEGTIIVQDLAGTILPPTPVCGIKFADIGGSYIENVNGCDYLVYDTTYAAPQFVSFSIQTQTNPLEIGATLAGGTRTFIWGTTNASNIQTNSLVIRDVTGGNVILASSLADDGNQAISISPITRNSASSYTWSITGTNTLAQTFTRNYTVNWQNRIYFGESTLTSLTAAQVQALRVNNLSSTVAGNYSMAAGGYKYWAFPVGMTQPTTFRDGAFDVAMTSPNPLQQVVITNAFGINVTYNVYRTQNILGAAITVAIS